MGFEKRTSLHPIDDDLGFVYARKGTHENFVKNDWITPDLAD